MEPKFTLNREKPGDEEINAHKDFDELVRKFKQQSIEKAKRDSNFLKNKKVTYSAVIAGAAVLCTVTYFTVFKKQPPTTNANDKIVTTQATSFSKTSNSNTVPAKPPVSKMAVPYTSYKVDAKKGATIKHHTKSKIHIPQTAFVNKQGQDIVGEVEIKYREFHNPAEIIASGMQMTYDSAGTRYYFESAGMFDIRGYQNGEPVYIKPNKIVTVDMASAQPADRFNQYALDTVQHNWTYLQRDTPKAMPHDEQQAPPAAVPAHATAASPKAGQLQKQIDRIPPRVDSVKKVYTQKIDALPQAVKPLKPIKATANRPQFELDVNYKEFPELAAFKNAVFEIGTENTNYTDDLSDITWSSAVISEGTQKGKNYLLTLKLRQRVEKLIVYPVLTGANYDEAVKGFEKRMSDYNTALANRQANEKRLQEQMMAQQKAYMEEATRLKEELTREQIRIRQLEEKQLAEQFKNMGNQDRVFRTFRVSNFGIFNSDCGNVIPKEAYAKATYGNENGQLMGPANVYLVEHGRNMLYTLSGENMYNLGYSPSKNYSLCVFANGGIYVCDAEQFKATVKNEKAHFTLSRLPDTVEDPNELRKALGI